jgi:Tol biopolymer transport system component
MKMNSRKSWMPLLLLFITSFIFSQTAVHTGAQPASLEREPLPIANYMLLPHPESETALGQQTPPAIPEGDLPIDSIGLWSRMVFQSYRDGVWNIYSSKHHGTELQQLTNEAAHNIHPDFNRGTSRIVFASQGPNSFAIHRMNSDGSSRVALTNGPGDDVYPRWSPDGSKIAFESYRDGQAEIYVMNGDGSQLQRLTHSPGFDGMPTWSPDGTKIAFVSQRSGVYRIWVMNADGSNPVQLSQTPSSAYPAWSPDGTKIAYSADSNQDGWLEVWVMNADGTNAYHVLSPIGNKDLWVRGWSPNSQYIAYTQVNFVQYHGVWFWTTAMFSAINPNNNWSPSIFSGLYDWHPHWQTSDAVAPTVSLHNYPQYAPPGPLLSWEGTNSGLSGLARFDLQYRPAGSGQWQDWLMDTNDTEAIFTAPLGDNYTFRIRGRDPAFNVSDWQVSSRPLTLYAWMLHGHTTDNAGVPVMDATSEVTPPPFLLRETGNTGQFALYIDQILSTYQANWHKLGYGSLPTSYYDGGQTEAQTHVVLPPTDDLVENGNFESGSLGPQWQTAGEYMPDVTNMAFNTGQYGVGMGREMLIWNYHPGLHCLLVLAPIITNS